MVSAHSQTYTPTFGQTYTAPRLARSELVCPRRRLFAGPATLRAFRPCADRRAPRLRPNERAAGARTTRLRSRTGGRARATDRGACTPRRRRRLREAGRRAPTRRP